MIKIGDYLDRETKRKIIKDSIRSGRIIHIRALFNSGDKTDKLCLVICKDPFLFFTISKYVSNYVRNNPHRDALQIPIDNNDYDCIIHPSVINCIELHSAMELDSAINQIAIKPQFYGARDYLKNSHKKEIIRKVLNSILYSERDKKIVVEGLSHEL